MTLHMQERSKGFSLIELLCVVAVIAVMVLVALPAMSSLTLSGQIGQSLQTLGSTLEMAHQYAINNNTYVWVVVGTNNVPNSNLKMGVIASTTGTDDLAWNPNTVTLSQATGYQLVGKVTDLPRIAVADTPTVTIKNLPSVSIPASPMSTTLSFAVSFGGQSLTFKKCIQFTPSGEARVGQSVARFIDVAVLSSKATNSPNQAVLRVGGTTGKTFTYRN